MVRCCRMCKSCKWFIWSYFCLRFAKSRRIIIHLYLQTKRSRGAIYFKLAFDYSLVPRQHPKICRSPKNRLLWGAVCRSIASQSLLQIEFELTEYPISGPDTHSSMTWMQPEGGYSPRLWLATFHCGMEYEKKTIPQGVPHHFSPHFFTPSLPYPYPLPLTFTVLPPHTPLPHRYSLSLSLSLPHPLTPTPSHSLALSLLPESWLEVSQQGVEGALGHSHSQEEMEQLLAAAVSDEELSDSDFTWAPPTLSHTRTYLILRPCSLTPVLISNQEPEAVQLLTSLASMALWWWGLILAVGDCITYNPAANWSYVY